MMPAPDSNGCGKACAGHPMGLHNHLYMARRREFRVASVRQPAKLAPGAVHSLADILVRAGVPKGVFKLVIGRGSLAGRAILDRKQAAPSRSPALWPPADTCRPNTAP